MINEKAQMIQVKRETKKIAFAMDVQIVLFSVWYLPE